MTRLLRGLFVAGVLVLPDATEACTCLPQGQPCAAYWEVAAVFVGRVDSISSSAPGRIGGSRVVRFSVLEGFRGVSGSVVEVRTGRGGGDCGYRFREGVEYVVYAYKQDESGELATGICTRTRPVEDAATDLTYARSLQGPDPPAGRISGQLMLHHGRAGGAAGPPPEPLPGITVVLESDRQTLRGITDRYGTFEFIDPAPATYTVRVDLSDRYYTGHIPNVRLPKKRACADVSIPVYHDGRVSGRVLDAGGRPIGGLTVGLASGEGRARTAILRTLTRGDGSYQFSRVPPMRFAIAIDTHFDPETPPAQHSVSHPGRFAMEPGARMIVPDFVLPPSVKFVAVTGVVLDADGYYAAGARVYLAGPHPGDAILGEPAITDSSGRFELAALAGREYRILAESVTARDAGSRVDSSNPVLVTVSPTLPPLRLELRARY